MVSDTTYDEREGDRDASTDLQHVIVEYEDGTDACTLYPRRCSRDEITTHWITAEEESFVDLEEMR